MGGFEEIDRALEMIVRHHERISILHCVSEYPTHPDNANLRSIEALADRYPSFAVGYSDHTIGISAPVAAVALGARIIEKHVTLDRQMKGTDQAGSLGIAGISRMVRDVRLIERSLGSRDKQIPAAAAAARHKLERSVASNRHIEPGEVISESDLWLLSPGTGYQWKDRECVIGRAARCAIPRNEIIRPEHLVQPE
jgi:sialic acid synthase